MLLYTILCYTILYYTILYYTIVYYTWISFSSCRGRRRKGFCFLLGMTPHVCVYTVAESYRFEISMLSVCGIISECNLYIIGLRTFA